MDIYRYATAFSGAYKWCINGTLDVQVLKLGLDELIARGEWRKLGARIRRNAEGRLEWHVPRQFRRNQRSFHPAQFRARLGIRSSKHSDNLGGVP